MKKEVIIVFDSGLGGLTVLKEFMKKNIHEHFIYLADSQNAPYGDKTKEEVILSVLNSFQKIKHLYDFKAIIIACNTASIYTKELLEHFYQVPVYSVLDSATRFLHTLPKGTKLDILATELTVNSHTYLNSSPRHEIREISCSPFVPFIESSRYEELDMRKELIHTTLSKHTPSKAEKVVLGCTHYPLIQEELQQWYGPNIEIINPSVLLASEIESIFPAKTKDFEVQFYVTKEQPLFSPFISSYFGKTLTTNTLFEFSEYENTQFA